MTASVGRPAWPYLAVGGVCGLTWAAALRGWMEQLATGSGTESAFTWLTEALLLIPATLVGVLLGRAAHHRACGTTAPRALIWAPALLATAIADPSIFHALITTGEGGGSLMVVITALCGGFTLSRPRWTIVRALTALTAALGLLLVTAIGSMAAPVQTARGAWVCLLGFSLVLLLSLAAVLPYPPAHSPLAPAWYVALGGLTGFAWAAGLRAVMADLAGIDSVVHAADTFGYLLLPATAAGALLGWAEYLRRHGDHPRRVLLALAPLTLWAVLLRDLVVQPDQGVDVAPLLVVLVGGAGAWTISGRGPRWPRAGRRTAVRRRDLAVARHDRSSGTGVRPDQRARPVVLPGRRGLGHPSRRRHQRAATGAPRRQSRRLPRRRRFQRPPLPRAGRPPIVPTQPAT